MECWSGKARPEHGKQTGQRARYGGAGKHRRITLTRVISAPSMLSSSHSKIYGPRVPACRHHRQAQDQRTQNCETRAVWRRASAHPDVRHRLGGYVLIEVDDPEAFGRYQAHHNQTYGAAVVVTFEPLFDVDKAAEETIAALR